MKQKTIKQFLDRTNAIEDFASTKSAQPIISLDTMDLYYRNSKIKINSPRSLIALKQIGLNFEDLTYISLKDFKLKTPDINSLPSDLQKSRYDYLESLRLSRIEEAKKIRMDLPQNFKENSNNFKPNLSHSQIKSTAINIELKSFELLKKKQENELLNMIQFELKTELMRKENEEMVRKVKEKEDEQKIVLLHGRKIEDEKKRQREKEILEKNKLEDDERKKKELEKYKEEQKKIKEELAVEKERLREARLRQGEEKRKQEEFRNEMEAMFEENRKCMEIKKSEMENKEMLRKEILEKKKLEVFMMNTERSKRKREKIENTMKNLENKLNIQREEYEEKQRKSDEKKKSYELMRELAFEKKKQESSQREEEMKQVLRRNEEINQGKVLEYLEKQKLIENKKLDLEYTNQLKQVKLGEKIHYREIILRQTLNTNEQLMNEKKNITMRKIERNDSKVRELNKIKERNQMEKCEQSCYRRISKEERLKQLSRMEENEREKALERLNDKSQRLDEFKFQRSVIAEQKREICDDIARKKKTYTDKFEQIFKKKKIDEKSINNLEQMFPQNPKITAMIQTLRNKNKNRNENEDYSTNSRWYTADQAKMPTIKINNIIDRNNFMRNADKKTTASSLRSNTANNIKHDDEKVFEKRRNEFRLRLNQKFLKILAEERKKEDDRETDLSNTRDPIERKKLEEVFGYERAQASKRIVKLNEYVIFI